MTHRQTKVETHKFNVVDARSEIPLSFDQLIIGAERRQR